MPYSVTVLSRRAVVAVRKKLELPEVVEDSFRIHGGYGFSQEYEIERLYREAPMLLIGEGTADRLEYGDRRPGHRDLV
jgi:alkylation response protein AidB-like acyl-CoA dehydrogenase